MLRVSDIKSLGGEEPDPKWAMHVKQLAQTVKHGRKITFSIFDGDPITGYLGGMDDNYFYVLAPTEEGYDRWIVRKSTSSAFLLHVESTYDREPHHAALEKVVKPFRGFVVNNILNGRSDSDARKAG